MWFFYVIINLSYVRGENMYTFLHLIDGYLNYQRGKAAGFWGLMGFVLVIILALNGVQIIRFSEFIGFNDFLYNIEVFREGDLFFIATWRFVLFIIGILLFIVIAITIFMLLFMLLAHSGPIMLILIGLLLCIVTPFVLVLLTPIFLYEFVRDIYFRLKDPEGYKEEKRLQKNSGKIEQLRFGLYYHEKEKNRKKIQKKLGNNAQEALNITTEHEDHDTLISSSEAYKHINRLPINGDYHFIVGVTYDREFYMILPGPINAYHLGRIEPGEVYCEKLDIKTKISTDMKVKEWNVDISIDNSDLYVSDIPKIPFSNFELFLDLYKVLDFQRAFEQYGKYSGIYDQKYVMKTQKGHFFARTELLNTLYTTETNDDYTKILEQIENHTLPNESEVRNILESQEQLEEEQQR